MDKESKSGSTGLPGNALVAAVLIGAGALFLREVPLEGTRPPANEPRIEQRFAQQDIDARLWQDPFGAIARARQDAVARLGAERARAEDERRSDRRLAAEIARKRADGVEEVVVLAVMLGGGPYAEYVETRRRTRYAVLAALNAERYAPFDTEHLGYFMPSDNARAPRDLPETVPYEWFEPAPGGRAPEPVSREVLVVWLDNDAFSSSPFARLKKLMNGLEPSARPNEQPMGKPAPRLRWRVLGPTGSDGLRAMVQELGAEDFSGKAFAGTDLRFLSPAATVPDETLVSASRLAAPGDSLTTLLERKGISLLRTIGDDRQLGQVLVDELERRGLKAHPSSVPAGDTKARRDKYRDWCRVLSQVPESPSHIAMVAEWDTLYGRSLRRQFDIDPETNRGFCITRLNYVRGLDGQMPERGSDVAAPAPAKQQGGGAAADKNRRQDGSLIERAEGQGQLDYLRRLAARLRERDAELRASDIDGAGIRAIGVVGNDVHDKLLVMQALKPDFPNAIFFTTDLDARFLHPREQAWARNLIVASNFGLRLDDGLQSGTPPFRDSYQSSTFLTTRLALDEIRRGEAYQPARLESWLAKPRLFEIGRTTAFDFSTPTRNRYQDGSQSCRRGDLETCPDIHPPGSPRYPHVPVTGLALLSSGLIFLLWFPALALSRPLQRRVRRFVARGSSGLGRWARRGGLALAVLLVQIFVPWRLALAWPTFADWLTGNGKGGPNASVGDGKPISLTEGISIWPTEAIYLFTLLLCIYLVFRGWTALARNLDQISRALHLGTTRRRLMEAQLREEATLGWWQRLANIFSLRPPVVQATTSAAAIDSGMSAAALSFWKLYIVQNRSSARFVRSFCCVLVVLAFGWLLIQAFGEPYGAPIRGKVSADAHVWIAGAAVVMLNFLVFYVADATLFSVRFARDLRALHSNWPARSVKYFQSRLGKLPPALIDHWIDLQFVARRTKCVTGLIYYPFIVLSLLLVSRNPVFDNWRLPTGMLVLAVLSVGIVLACVVALRRVAESSRSQALRAIDEALLRANADPSDNVPPTTGQPVVVSASKGQLELLRRQVEELREGAFAPFSQQPLLKALALPFATLGGTAVLDYLAMANV